jgi:hypothetical protein
MSILPYPEEEHQARVMCGDPIACSWEWIKAYAKNLSGKDYNWDVEGHDVVITPEELIETAETWLETDNEWGGDYLNKGGLLESISTDPTFWEKLAILKEIEIPHEKRNNFFSCSC